MNFDNLGKMVSWERQKALFILSVAEKLGMDTEGYGELAVNQNSGYTYLWLEDYNFTLYMPISCKLETNDIWVMWTNSIDGEEKEIQLNNMSLEDIYKWVEAQEKEMEEDNDQEEDQEDAELDARLKFNCEEDQRLWNSHLTEDND